MAEIIVMPRLGNTVESCLVTTWLVSIGDEVDANTSLCEVETDKSSMEVPAGVSGTVRALLAEEGDDVPVMVPIVIIGTPDENIDGLVPESTETAEEPPSAAAEASAPSPGAEDDHDRRDSGDVVDPASVDQPAETRGAASPRARTAARDQGVDLAAVAAGSGPHGRVIERDVLAAAAAGPRQTAGARAQGGDPRGREGTGLGGRVTTADLATAPAASVPAAAPPAGDFPGEYTDTPLKSVRKIIAERMMNALATSAQLTYNTSAVATGLLGLRKRFKSADAELGFGGITIGDLVCYATVKTLARHENLNAHLTDGSLRTFRSVHLGLAVDTPRGLLVPTVRNADSLSLREFSAATKALAEQAITGAIDPSLLSGATFTVSNLGAFGIESFTPIINVPQTGILGVDTIGPRATMNPDGSAGVEMRIGLSLTADHQVVDGADAARFLADLTRAIDNIDLTIAG